MTYLDVHEEGPRLVRLAEAADEGSGFVAKEMGSSIELFWMKVMFFLIGDDRSRD